MDYIYQAKSRTLSKAQLRLPFFKTALNRLTSLSENRETYLTQLNLHASGRRTRTEFYDAVEKVAEQILLRLDLSTGALGWRDSKGNFRVSSQTQLAADSGVSTSVLSRVFGRFLELGYIKRDISHISTRRGHFLWSVKTRTLISFTDRFFKHLGVHYEFSKARKWADKKTRAKLRAAGLAGELPEQQVKQKVRKEMARKQKRKGFQGWIDIQREQLEREMARKRLKIQVRVMKEQGGRRQSSREEFDQQVEAILMRENPGYVALKTAI